MKYEIEKRFLPVGTNRPGKKLKPEGIVSHRTGNPDPTADALMHYRYFSSRNRDASAHVFVDSERILQIIPFDEVAWHAGYEANHKYIGIELCENHPRGTPEFEEAYKKYVWLHAWLCKKFGWDPYKDIKGHFQIDPEDRPDDPIGLFDWQAFLDDVNEEYQNLIEEESPVQRSLWERIKSRKFLLALANFIFIVLTEVCEIEVSAEAYFAITGGVIAFILGESYVDVRK